MYICSKIFMRDQLPFSKYMLDYILRFLYLHRLINWHIGFNNEWNVEVGALGKYYKKLLNEDDWNDFENTMPEVVSKKTGRL